MAHPLDEFARARRLVTADGQLVFGNPSKAAAELGWATDPDSRAEQTIMAAVIALEADAAGRAGEAESLYMQIVESELPLPGVLLSAGRFFAAHGRNELAGACLARAWLCGYGDANVSDLRRNDLSRRIPERLKQAVDQSASGFIGPLCLLKHALLSKFSWFDALTAYGALFAKQGVSRIDRLPLVGLRGHAMRQAIRFTELLPERELPLKMPTIVGAPPAKAVSAYARSLFYAELRDIVVTSQSTLLEVEGGLLYDFQARELEAVPIDFRFDTVVFDARDGTADIVRIGRIEQEIAEAISLVGSSSHAFGHWVSEYLLKFFVLEHAGVAPNAPILIDAGMPIQHREALEFFSYGRHPIIEVPSFSSVRVDKLWVCATFAFVPIMPKPGHAADPSSCSLHAAWFAALLRGVRKPERSLDPSRRRLFLSRRPTSKRNLENLSEVEEICQKRGFVSVYPEDLPFDEQLFLLHNATHVVGPSGSALISPILYGNPSMKMLAFRPPFVEDAPIWASIADARGMEVLVILGDVCRKDPHFRLNSDYRVDPVIVERALTTWGL